MTHSHIILKARAWTTSTLTLLLLAACTPERIKPDYHLSNLLPTPVTPGDTITAFGLLPENASISVNTTRITNGISNVPDGLQFNVPKTITAGDHKVIIQGDDTILEGLISINPRVDSASFDGATLKISGAGWAGLSASTLSGNTTGSSTSTASNLSGATSTVNAARVVIDGLEYAPTLEPSSLGNTNTSPTDPGSSNAGEQPSPNLKVKLPAGLPYGSFTITVRVADRSSKPVILNREAGAVQGSISLPANTAGTSGPNGLSVPGAVSIPSLIQPNRSSLIVHHTGPSATDPAQTDLTPSQAEITQALNAAGLTGLLEVEVLPAIHVSRWRFGSATLAARALNAVQNRSGSTAALASSLRVERVSFDTSVEPSDAFPAIDVTQKVQSGAFGSSAGTGTSKLGLNALGLRPLGLPTLEPGAGQWSLALQGIPAAWNASRPARGTGVVIAVVDTGVDLQHPDLAANMLPGWDFIDDDNQAQDIAGHGTHVAGLAAANGTVKGVAPNARIVPVRVLRDLSGGTAFPVAQGILWAAGLLETPSVPKNPNPAQVINLSLGSRLIA